MKKRTWAHLAPPRLTLAPPGRLWGYPPAQKLTQINRKRISEHETPEKKRRRPKTFQEHPTLAEVFHRGSDAVRSLPQKLSLRGAASRSLHQKPPAASKFPQRGGLGEAHLDPPRHAESMELGVLNQRQNPPKSGSEENPYPSLAAAGPPREYHGSSKFAPRITLRKNDRNCCKNEPNRPPKRAPKIIKIMQNVV